MEQTQILPEMIYKTKKASLFKQKLIITAKSRGLNIKEFIKYLLRSIEILNNENKEIRPVSSQGYPGGIINLNKNIPTLIVSDLHGRRDYLLNVLFNYSINGVTNLNLLMSKKLQIVCVGDGMHSEMRGYERWKLAYEEYLNGYSGCPNMDEEMMESFSLMKMVMLLKLTFPENFHFLKGNHENILNEQGNGNHPFAKFALEGEMVKAWVEMFLGDEFLGLYNDFEASLPLLCIGKDFLISHAEPYMNYSYGKILNYKDNPDVIEGLTWTDNNSAKKGSVVKMLKAFFPNTKLSKLYYFGGHRQVAKMYNKRANGKYIQVNNQNEMYTIFLPENEIFNPDTHIYNVKPDLNKTRRLINTANLN